MDERVKDVQEWLNATYGKVAGFDESPKNGRTGWATIYSLREGLQYELGVSPLGQGFGEKTRRALAGVIGTIKPGYKGKIVKLIKGAFWCKGISPGDFSETFDTELTKAIRSLQADAGIEQSGTLSVELVAALFDMSAFSLIWGRGDAHVREIQQALNKKYWREIGILPCDGIYQRSTNTALIYALQRTVGMSADVANGNYGPGTVNATPTVNQGASGDLVRIIQYGLYVNGFFKGEFAGEFNSYMASEIVAFRKFMNLPPFTSTADLTVIKGLLTSNGNTDRDSDASDTSAQMTERDARNFKRYGFDIVGRYLTGTVGTGAKRRDKFLTHTEIKNITSAGMRIFPIYQDGGSDEDYFSLGQGYADARTAAVAARRLGFPAGTTIYFAVDVDVQEGDMEGTVEPYMNGVINGLAATEFSPGIYGTRNVCLHGAAMGMKHSFVSDMSYGWSGNLGFKMPKNWAFDQFIEYTIGGTPIDQNASSGRDLGTAEFASREPEGLSGEEVLDRLEDMSVSLNKKRVLYEDFGLKLTLEAELSFSSPNGAAVFSIKNGELDSASLSAWIEQKFSIPSGAADLLMNKVGEMTLISKITAGNLTLSLSAKSAAELTLSLSFNIHEFKGEQVKEELSITLEATVRTNQLPGELEALLAKVPQQMWTVAVVAIAIAVVVFGSGGATIGGIIAAISAFLARLLPALALG